LRNYIDLKQRILIAINELGPECGSVEIGGYLKTHGGEVTIGRLFAALDSLESDDDVISEQRPGGAEREYRPKRVFWLTGHGLAKAREATKNE
jgi:hypothetical protein